jgi:hypothetical protein
MKRLTCSLVLTALLLHSPSSLLAQPQQRAMTNKDIILLTKAGFGAELIIAKIRSSGGSFDTSVEALTELKAAGVPEAVMVMMMEAAEPTATGGGGARLDGPTPSARPSSFVPSASQSSMASASSANSLTTVSSELAPEFGELSELTGAESVYVYADDLEDRKIIVNADSPESADFVLFLVMSERRLNTTGTWFLGSYVVSSDRRYTGAMMAVSRGAVINDRPRPRIHWSTRKIKDVDGMFGISFNRHPATNGTRQFLKELTAARLMYGHSKPGGLTAPVPRQQRPSAPVTAEAVQYTQPAKRICAQNGYRVPCPEDRP